MQSQPESRLSRRIVRPLWARRRMLDGELALSLQHLDDDGSPPAPVPEELSAFTLRDWRAEPRRDERELGGES